MLESGMDEERFKGGAKDIFTSEKGSRHKQKQCNEGAFAEMS